MNIYKLEKFARGIIYCLPFFPFIIVAGTLWPLVFARNIIFYCVAAVLLGLAIISAVKNKHNINFRANFLFRIIFIFLVIFAFSGIFGADFSNSFFGFQPRMGGILAYTALFSWLLCLLIFLNTDERWFFLFRSSVIASLAVAVASAVLLLFPGLSGNSEGMGFFEQRMGGILDNPIFLAGYLLPHIFLSLLLAVREKNKKLKFFWFFAAAILTFSVLMTQTRGASIALGASFVFLMIFYAFDILRAGRRALRRLAPIAMLILGGAVYLALNPAFLGRLLNTSIASDTAATRIIAWKMAASAFLDRPLLGWGPENFIYAVSKFYNPRLLKYSFYETWADKPHNQFLEMFAVSGIFGGVLFILIFGSALLVIYRLIKKNNENRRQYVLLAGAILSYMGHIFFSFDTSELRIAMFIILAYAIFLYYSVLGKGKKVSPGFLRNLLFVFFAVLIISLNAIGIKSLRASYYASSASNSILLNDYSKIEDSIEKLSKIKRTPYRHGNWEYLADVILKADAGGRIPAETMRRILPFVASGLDEAQKRYPQNFSYAYRLAQMYNMASRYISRDYADKSLEMAEKAKEISPDRQVVDILLAQIYYEKRDIQKGIEILEKLIEKNPDIAEPYWFLGILSDARGEYDKSYAYMVTAVESGRVPKNINEEMLYVTVLGRYKDYKRMALVYKSILKKVPENAGVWANLAVVYLELGKYDDARNAARQAMFLDPKFGDEGENFLKKVDEREYGQ